MSTLNRKIKEGVKKDSALLLAELNPAAEVKSEVADSLSKVSDLLEQHKQLDLDRKKLSRQIGAARKENKDPAPIIAGVAELSAKLKQIATDVDAEIALVEQKIGTADNDADTVATVPLHLTCADKKLDFDLSELQLAYTDRIDESEWQSFVGSVKHANVYHDAKWCALIKQNFGHTPYYFTARKPNGELCGVFPTVHLKSRLFGSFVVSMPYFNYGGPLSEFPAVDQKMMEYASEIGKQIDCTHIEVRETLERSSWLSKQHKVTMILPLPKSNEELDKQLGSKVRAQVNRAAKEELEFTVGGIELLAQFYKVFSHNMRDLGTPVYSKKFFACILERFPDKANIAVVNHKQQPVAVGFLLGHNDKLEIPWASSLRKANPLGANMFMYRNILRTAIEQQYEFFDFGRSSLDASTYKFKKQWGALEHPLHWHYWLNGSDELPELNPNNPKYKLVISAWQKLPLVVANNIGPLLVRNLP